MKNNPFKFGSVVDRPYFTNRKDELEKIQSILNSQNHLIIISPRRYGKTSLIHKALKANKRPSIIIDMMLITDTQDLAAQLLKRIYKIYPFEKIKQFLKSFKVIPNISLNPLTNEIDISFQTSVSSDIWLQDVLNLIEKLSLKKDKLIVVFDEFQEILRIEKQLDRKLRSIMQHHNLINYVFLGSQESMMRNIFERKESPFYHFAYLLPLGKIPETDFNAYINNGFKPLTKEYKAITREILNITASHPYYTQMLAFTIWELLLKNKTSKHFVDKAINELILIHDNDFERLWNRQKKTDMKILIGLSQSKDSPLSESFRINFGLSAPSTVFSGLKRLAEAGLIVKSEQGYELDDPIFKRWIIRRRSA